MRGRSWHYHRVPGVKPSIGQEVMGEVLRKRTRVASETAAEDRLGETLCSRQPWPCVRFHTRTLEVRPQSFSLLCRLYSQPLVATHHDRGAESISRARGHLGVTSRLLQVSTKAIFADLKARDNPTPQLCLDVCRQVFPPEMSPSCFSSGHISILSEQ